MAKQEMSFGIRLLVTGAYLGVGIPALLGISGCGSYARGTSESSSMNKPPITDATKAMQSALQKWKPGQTVTIKGWYIKPYQSSVLIDTPLATAWEPTNSFFMTSGDPSVSFSAIGTQTGQSEGYIQVTGVETAQINKWGEHVLSVTSEHGLPDTQPKPPGMSQRNIDVKAEKILAPTQQRRAREYTLSQPGNRRQS